MSRKLSDILQRDVAADPLIEGVTAGLDDYGFLRVLKPDGAVETILAGGVRPA